MQMMRTEICSFGVKSVPIRTPATDAMLFLKHRRGKVTPLDTEAGGRAFSSPRCGVVGASILRHSPAFSRATAPNHIQNSVSELARLEDPLKTQT